jgi:diketogulonate reductase-like aldo/keto reductase
VRGSVGIRRKDVFLTTKVWVANYPDRAFAASVDESLRKLRTDCVDFPCQRFASILADRRA